MSINVFTFSGNIGKDCQIRVTPNGKTIASFSVPVKQGFGDHEKVSWINCKLFGKRAESLPQYLLKGVKVTVTGEFVQESWKGQDGVEKSMPVVIVNSLDFGSSNQQQSSNRQATPQQQAQPVDDGLEDEDIPF